MYEKTDQSNFIMVCVYDETSIIKFNRGKLKINTFLYIKIWTRINETKKMSWVSLCSFGHITICLTKSNDS